MQPYPAFCVTLVPEATILQCPFQRTTLLTQMRSLHTLAPSEQPPPPGACAPARLQDHLATPFDLRPGAPAGARDGLSLTTVRCTACSADSNCSTCRAIAVQAAGAPQESCVTGSGVEELGSVCVIKLQSDMLQIRRMPLRSRRWSGA